MKVKIELFGAARDFSEQNLLELDLDRKSTIKDIRKKMIQYLDQKFKDNENYKKLSILQLFVQRKIILLATIIK